MAIDLDKAKWPSASQLSGGKEYFDNIPQTTYYQPMDQSQLRGRAEEYSDMYSQPLYSELERSLEQAIADAQAQEERIRAAYSGMHDTFQRREQDQQRQDVESAIARGAGRSGVVPYLAQQRQERFAELIAAEEAKKSAELAGVANQLGLVQRQIPDQRMGIAEQASRIASQELERLRDLDYQRGREYDVDQFQRALNVYELTHLTPLQQLQLYLDMAQVAGKFPARAPSITGS